MDGTSAPKTYGEARPRRSPGSPAGTPTSRSASSAVRPPPPFGGFFVVVFFSFSPLSFGLVRGVRWRRRRIIKRIRIRKNKKKKKQRLTVSTCTAQTIATLSTVSVSDFSKLWAAWILYASSKARPLGTASPVRTSLFLSFPFLSFPFLSFPLPIAYI